MSAASGETSRIGYTFVANGMQPYSTKETSAKTIYELSENLYITGPVSQMINLIISRDASITVYDEKDDPVEDLSRKLNRMFSQKYCSLNGMIRTVINDLFIWGISIWNPVWTIEDNELVCTECRNLRPVTFSRYPEGGTWQDTRTYGRLLKGIYYSTTDNRIHYHQQQMQRTVELPAENLFVVTDPSSQNPDGTSVILPVAPIAEFLEFAWSTLKQQMNRTAAPVMFISIRDPQPETYLNGEHVEGDVEYAEKILNTWGKDTGFSLRDNMEVHTIDVKEGSLAKSAIQLAAQAIEGYISPVGMLGQDGSLISGNSDASIRLINNHIQGWINMVKSALRELPNYYLQHNGYPDSWHAELNIPMVTIEDNENRLSQAKLLAETRTGTVNEVRELLGREGISEEEIVQMRKDWEILQTETV